jgi:hypothetical protein
MGRRRLKWHEVIRSDTKTEDRRQKTEDRRQKTEDMYPSALSQMMEDTIS